MSEQAAKWICFEKVQSDGRKTAIYAVRTTEAGEDLGEVKFWPRWRKFTFFPLAGTIYEKDCLRDIANFCEEKTAEWRKGRTV